MKYVVKPKRAKACNTTLKYLFLFTALFCVEQLHAQQYSLSDTGGAAYAQALNKSYTASNELFLDDLKEKIDERSLWKYCHARYKELFKALNEEIKDRKAAEIPAISKLTDSILQEIKSNNPDVPKDLRVMYIRDNHPNAYTIGDNTLFVNVGLYYYMQSEDQVAGVLAHEIGHLMLEHSLGAMKRGYEGDKKSAENVRQIREVEVKRSDKALAVLKKSIYKNSALTRLHELEADSMSYELLSNTNYNPADYVQALRVMDDNDTINYGNLKKETYKQFFDLPEQAFNDEWLASEDFSSYNYNAYKSKFNEDSVSSHPKAEERVAYLTTVFPDIEKTPIATADEGYGQVQQVAKMQRVPNLYYSEQYGEAVYLLLIFLQEDPEHELYKKWLGINLQKIYEARKDYQLNKYLDRVAPQEQTESYIRYLNFMWNLSLKELEAMAVYYNPKG